MTAPRAIFFDAAGTLIHLPRGVGFHYRNVARRHGCELEEAALSAAFRASWKAMPPRASTRKARADDDRGWWRELVWSVLDALRVAPSRLDRDAYFAELYDEFTRPGVWEIYPEIGDVLTALAARHTLCVVSNFDARLRTILTDLGLTDDFQHIVLSSEVGADKPDPWIFQHALDLCGLDAGAVLHVGDDPRCDWGGAESAGLQVFRLQRPENDLRALLEPQ